MGIAEAIEAIERCSAPAQVQGVFQGIVQGYGFSSFAFLDVGHRDQPPAFVIPVDDKAWVQDYVDNNFVMFDPVLAVVKRANAPFRWSNLPSPVRTGKRKSGAFRTMEAAQDRGFRDGFVIPIHFVDFLGRPNTASCVLFWRATPAKLSSMLTEFGTELRVLATYFAQHVIPMLLPTQSDPPIAAYIQDGIILTDRERAVLEWAARGRTSAETAHLLSISPETVEQHVRNATRKLGAANKTQAAVQAVKLRLIDL